MQQPFTSSHVTENDNPAGGWSAATGIDIVWQDGPLGRGADRKEPNGAFVETVLAIAADRIKYYQASRFNCEENARALQHIEAAIACLNARTGRREVEQTEGTHSGH